MYAKTGKISNTGDKDFSISMQHIPQLADILVFKLKDYFAASKRHKAVIGISGGVDSAVVASLAVRAIGTEKVVALRMPHTDFSSAENLNDAREVCNQLQLDAREIDIAPLSHPFFGLPFVTKPMTKGNIMARTRMILLYAAANEHDGLVLGTGNKTEMLTGFFTKYGDGGVDVEVLGEVWKTEVFALAKHFGLPENVYTKPPSAELLQNHTDEAELGIDYPTLDATLQKMENDEAFSPSSPAEQLVVDLVKNTEHKRGEVPALSRSN